jgi:hypothetical protein
MTDEEEETKTEKEHISSEGRGGKGRGLSQADWLTGRNGMGWNRGEEIKSNHKKKYNQ